MPFSRKDMVGEHYSWAEGSKTLFTGNPSRRTFNRYNGDQVLFLINSYGSQADQFTIQEGQQMEEMISKHLPLEAKSEISVLNWLRGTPGTNS